MEPTFGYTFPAIRGIQAQREYYVSMCPLRLINKIFMFDEEELRPEMRVQRTLNKGRIPEMARYVIDNPKDYIFSAITASIDGDVGFDSFGTTKEGKSVGSLHVPMEAKFIINDGQHRRAAIKEALEQDPTLGDETIAVVFFLDIGLQRSQQMFADLNRHAVRPSKSLGVLFDHRDEKAKLSRLLVLGSEFFKDIVEMERSSLSKGSRKLITLSSLYSSTTTLLREHQFDTLEDAARAAREYWEAVAANIPEWQMVQRRDMASGGVRKDFVHSHGTVIQALGRVGHDLLKEKKSTWKRMLKGLKSMDWSRSNNKLWEGRIMVAGQVKKSSNNIILGANAIKRHLKMPLSADEQRVEDAFLGKKKRAKSA